MATTKKSTQKASSGKRKAPAAKTHQAMPKEAVVSQITKDLWGVGCLALAVLAALSWLDGASALSHFFSGLVGPVGQIALPIALLLCAIALLTHGDAVAMRVICSLSFALLISALSHLILSSTQVDLNWEMFSILYRQGLGTVFYSSRQAGGLGLDYHAAVDYTARLGQSDFDGIAAGHQQASGRIKRPKPGTATGAR